FSRIIECPYNYQTYSLADKIKLFLPRLGNFLIGRRKVYCRELIDSLTGGERYDIHVVPSDYGIYSGAVIANAKTDNVVILEDGTGDYLPRPKWFILKRLNNPNDIAGFLLAKMGYCNSANNYRLHDTNYCVKYSSMPNEMIYRDYKEINPLFDFTHTDTEQYNSLISRTFFDGCKCDLSRVDAVFFTAALTDFGGENDKFYAATEQYLDSAYSGANILLKLHPRDTHEYVSRSNTFDLSVRDYVPAEVIITAIKDKPALLMFPSTVIFALNAVGADYKILYYKELSKLNPKYDYFFRTKTEQFGIGADRILEL
ncbi:MAG: hypothetical protein IJC18_00830, partial [Clostridia bacterium]|nr:hypothetical protein [Clostridia bacterium]